MYHEHMTNTHKLHAGYFTIVEPSATSAKGTKAATFRIGRAVHGVNAVIAHQNVATRVWTPIGTVNMTTDAIHLFESFRRSNRLINALLKLKNDPHAASLAYAERTGRCSRCGRTLKHPVSVCNGIGPECAKRLGGE